MTKPKIAVISAFFALMLGLNKQGYCEKPFQDSVLLWNPRKNQKSNTFACLMIRSPERRSEDLAGLFPCFHEILNFRKDSFLRIHGRTVLRTHSSLTTEDLIPYLNLEKIEQNLPSQSFWESHYEEYLSQRQTLTIENLALVQLAYLKNNDSSKETIRRFRTHPIRFFDTNDEENHKPNEYCHLSFDRRFRVSFPQQIRKKLPGGFRLGQAKDYLSGAAKGG